MFKGWSLFEKLWLLIFAVITVVLFFVTHDSITGLVASLSGMICVVLVAVGKKSNYIFGLINVLTYAYLSFNQHLYGEVMLNMLFYLPVQFIGYYLWSKKSVEMQDTKVVEVKKLTDKGLLNLTLIAGFSVIGYGLILMNIGGHNPFVDATTVSLSIIAQILMLKRYAEQWLLWIVVNILGTILWVNAYIHSGNDITVLAMWIAQLFNSVWAYFNWNKLFKKQSEIKEVA